MRKIPLALLALLMPLSLANCSPPSPIIELNPQTTLNASNVGGNKPITLQVIDARSQTSTNTYANAKINPAQNVAQLFEKQIHTGLAAEGFQITPSEGATQVTVKILQLDYSVASGLFGTNTQTDVSAKINATSPTAGTYQKTYYAHNYSDDYLSAGTDPSQQMNQAVNKLLESLLNDHALIQFLAK